MGVFGAPCWHLFLTHIGWVGPTSESLWHFLPFVNVWGDFRGRLWGSMIFLYMFDDKNQLSTELFKGPIAAYREPRASISH